MVCKNIVKDIEERENIVTLEAPSYRGSDLESYFEQVSKLGYLDKVNYMNICNNPIGKVHIDPIPISYNLVTKYSIPTVTHLTCKNTTLSSIQRWLLGADSLGINNLLVVSGDHGIGDYEGEPTPKYMNSLKIIEGINRYLNQGFLMPDYSDGIQEIPDYKNNKSLDNPTEFTVGGVLIPGRRNEIRYAKKKIKAGVDFFQTQITYDKENISKFINALNDVYEDCPPILISIRPISSLDEINYIHKNIPEVNVPDKIVKRIKNSSDIESTAIEIALETYTHIKDSSEEDFSDLNIGLHIIPGDNYSLAGKIIEEVKKA
ncbi:MAG: methylenetetrahydrofolate reductase [Thermoplasmatota archaeon]